jgi:PPOX class probable F420-dependent enzyme
MTSPLTMTKAEREAFLADLHVGVLAVETAGDEPPLAAPVWYGYEPGGDVLISTGTESVKAKLLAAAGRASFCVQREALPYAFVTVEGPAVVGGPDEEERRRIAIRYLGEEMAAGYITSTADSPSVMVRLTPERWRTQDYTKLPGF